MTTSTHAPPYTCGCGAVLDCASGLQHGEVPEPGAISLCFCCGALLTFREDLTQRELTEDEIVALPAQVLQLLARAEEVRRLAQARRRGRNLI